MFRAHGGASALGSAPSTRAAPLERIDLGVQRGDAPTLPHTSRWRCEVRFRQLRTCHRVGSGQQCADIVAKVAEASLWNSNLKQSNRGVRTFESMLRVRVKI
jgi:hypothetical protein